MSPIHASTASPVFHRVDVRAPAIAWSDADGGVVTALVDGNTQLFIVYTTGDVIYSQCVKLPRNAITACLMKNGAESHVAVVIADDLSIHVFARFPHAFHLLLTDDNASCGEWEMDYWSNGTTTRRVSATTGAESSPVLDDVTIFETATPLTRITVGDGSSCRARTGFFRVDEQSAVGYDL
jgi:hypothetical protein